METPLHLAGPYSLWMTTNLNIDITTYLNLLYIVNLYKIPVFWLTFNNKTCRKENVNFSKSFVIFFVINIIREATYNYLDGKNWEVKYGFQKFRNNFYLEFRIIEMGIGDILFICVNFRCLYICLSIPALKSCAIIYVNMHSSKYSLHNFKKYTIFKTVTHIQNFDISC